MFKNVEVDKVKLISTLEENKLDHVATYNQTVAGYVEDATAKLEEEYAEAKKKLDEAYGRIKHELQNFDPEKTTDTIVVCERISFTLTAPVSHEKDYNDAITMLQWENRDKLELSPSEFRNFVLDEWDWSHQFAMTTGCYVKGSF